MQETNILELDEYEILDHLQQSAEAASFQQILSGKIIGQAQAVKDLSDIFQVYCAGLAPEGRPIGTLLFLGPTGSGKTRTVEAAAEVIFGDARAVIKIDCAEFQHAHEIAKLKGSPAGYVGHRETNPMLTQENLDRCHNEHHKLTFLLFDEIEKASDALWNLLLGILDKATLTLGDNRKVDFSRAIIVMTSNLGAREMHSLVSKKMGFTPSPTAALTDERVDAIAVEAAQKEFSPEFINRIDKIAVFKTLTTDAISQILALELEAVQRRMLKTLDQKFKLSCTPEAKRVILEQGINKRYNARPLKRAVERLIMLPLANLLASSQLQIGDEILVDAAFSNGGLIFKRRKIVETTNLLAQIIAEIVKEKRPPLFANG